MMRQMPGHLCNKTTGKIINNNSMPKTKNSDQKPAKAEEMEQTKEKWLQKNKNTGKIPKWYHYQTKIDLAK